MTRPAASPPEEPAPPNLPVPPPRWRHWLLPVALGLAVVLAVTTPTKKETPEHTRDYSEFVAGGLPLKSWRVGFTRHQPLGC